MPLFIDNAADDDDDDDGAKIPGWRLRSAELHK